MNPDMTISEAFEQYRLDVIVYKNQSAKTEEMSLCACKSLVNFVGDIPIKDLTFDMVRKWSSDLRRTRASNTVRGYILKVRVVLKYLRLNELDVLDPDIVGIPKRDSHVVDYLEVGEVQAMLKASFKRSPGYSKFKRYRNRAMIALLFSAGLRNSELCQLDRHQIKPGVDSFTVIGKGNKPRICFIDPMTAKYIEEYLELRDDPYPALFVSEQKKGADRIHPSSVQMVVKNCALKAGLSKNVHPHTLRHSFATDLLRSNTNITYISKFLGHANVQITMAYTHVVDEDLHDIHKAKHTVIHA